MLVRNISNIKGGRERVWKATKKVNGKVGAGYGEKVRGEKLKGKR
jgi:hypothetical protein